MSKLIRIVDVMIVLSASALVIFVFSLIPAPKFSCEDQVFIEMARLVTPTESDIKAIEDRVGCRN